VTGKQKHKVNLVLFLTVLQFWAIPQASGQHLPDTIILDEVSIIHTEPLQQAGLLRASIDSVSLSLMQGRSLSELLGLRSSLHIKSTGRGALATASFRGTDASHTKVYWNGMRINSPMTGQVDFSLIPVISLDDLTLLYGGSSLTSGSGAFGGAVLIGNSAGRKEGFSMELNQEAGSFGTFSSSGKLSAGGKKFRSETSLYHNRSANDYPYYNTDIIPGRHERLASAAYKMSGIMQEIYLRPADAHSLSLNLWYQDSFRELPPVMSFEGSGRKESQGDRNLRSSLAWSYYTERISMKVRSAFLSSTMDYDLDHRDIDYTQYMSRSHENNILNMVRADIELTKQTKVRFRLDMNRYDAKISDLVREEGYHHVRLETTGLAGFYHQAGEDMMLYSLVRLERADGRWLPLMPSAGFRYKFGRDREISLKGTVCRNYNLPSLNDLYWVPGGNPGLRPERGISSDMGLAWEHKNKDLKINASTNLFTSWVSDWIVWRPTMFRYWEAENLARVFSRGLESRIDLESKWRSCLINISGNYTLTRSTNESDTGPNDYSRGSQLVYIPVHRSSFHMNITKSGYFMGSSMAYTGRRHTQPSNTSHDFLIVLKPYLLTNLYLGKDFSLGRNTLGLQFSVNNLINTSYQAVLSRPMPLRNYSLRIKWKI